MKNLNSAFEDKQFVFSGGSNLKPVYQAGGYFVRTDFTVITPSAQTFASATDLNLTTDVITEIGHSFLTGLVGQFTTDGTLPTGLSLATDYYIIKIDDDSYKVATTLLNAKNGVAVNMTGLGSGNQTFTPLTLAGATVKLQACDIEIPTQDSHWRDVADSEVAISASDVCSWNVSEVHYINVRYFLTITAGQVDVTANFNGKGWR